MWMHAQILKEYREKSWFENNVIYTLRMTAGNTRRDIVMLFALERKKKSTTERFRIPDNVLMVT